MIPTPFRRLAAGFFLPLLAASLALAACEGSNAFVNPPEEEEEEGGPNGNADTTPPGLVLVLPKHDTSTVAPGDSMYFEARVTDNVGVDSVIFEAFALRGSVELGTQTRVDRFTPKVVALRELEGKLVKSDTVRRYLYAVTGDSTAERVFAVATVVDTAGNRVADTVRVSVGGPRVSIVSPAPGAEFRGGTEIQVRVTASDPDNLIRSFRLSAAPIGFDQTFTRATPVATIDTTITVPLPADSGNVTLTAEVVSGTGFRATGIPVVVRMLPPISDVTAPRVTYSVLTPVRVEPDDSFRVAVSATDETRVDSVGVTVLAFRRTPTSETLLAVLQRRVQAQGDTMRFGYGDIPQLTGLDTATLSLEVTAYGVDPAHNCGAATSTGAAQSQPCQAGPQGSRVGPGPGRIFTIFVARGRSMVFPNPGDVLADLVADSQRVYLSNFTRNRVETVALGSLAYGDTIAVGSQPWGLALGRNRDSLYVANSGGTNISVIPVRGVGPDLREDQGKRIFTRNERLFSVNFSSDGSVGSVLLHDYSDRPQFIAQASNGLLVYSTRPTASASDGTVRIYDPRKLRSEIFIGYVDRHTANVGVVVNADSAFKAGTSVMVCPRRRFGDTADPGFCIVGDPVTVADSLTALRSAPANAAGGRWDTRLDLGAPIDSVGFSDTTFVAVSGDRNFVAVGEGARTNARIPLFEAGGDSLVMVGDVRDLVSNTAERVIGLGLNFDGSLGVARGDVAYLFTDTLRLQGSVASGPATGGVAMHPEGFNYPAGPNRLAFVSGEDAKAPYIDVIDTFNFFRVNRIYIRDPVVGALAVAPRVASDPANVVLRLYALTPNGVVSLQVTAADLVPPP